MEETTILTQASNTEQGFVTQKLLMEQLGYAHTYIQKGHKAKQLFFFRWTDFRARQALDKVVSEGLCWIDKQGETESYWFPSLFPGRTS